MMLAVYASAPWIRVDIFFANPKKVTHMATHPSPHHAQLLRSR
jgi:hypothetical protein